MPEAKKVSWAQLRVGIMAAVAMAILGVLIFLLTGSGDLFARYGTIYTYRGGQGRRHACSSERHHHRKNREYPVFRIEGKGKGRRHQHEGEERHAAADS